MADDLERLAQSQPSLRFGDVKPNGVLGGMLTSSEVIIGYVTLGLLLAVLQKRSPDALDRLQIQSEFDLEQVLPN